MANYRLTPQADEDIGRLYVYGVERWGEAAADHYLLKLYDHFQELASNPLAYPVTKIREGYRRSVCGVERIYYRINEDTVEIVAILGRQDERVRL